MQKRSSIITAIPWNQACFVPNPASTISIMHFIAFYINLRREGQNEMRKGGQHYVCHGKLLGMNIDDIVWLDRQTPGIQHLPRLWCISVSTFVMGKEIAYIMFACVLFCSWVGNRFFGCNNVGICRSYWPSPGWTAQSHAKCPSTASIAEVSWMVCMQRWQMQQGVREAVQGIGAFSSVLGFYDMQVKHP